MKKKTRFEVFQRDQFKNIYRKEPTERELRCYVNYKKTGYCGQIA